MYIRRPSRLYYIRRFASTFYLYTRSVLTRLFHAPYSNPPPPPPPPGAAGSIHSSFLLLLLFLMLRLKKLSLRSWLVGLETRKTFTSGDSTISLVQVGERSHGSCSACRRRSRARVGSVRPDRELMAWVKGCHEETIFYSISFVCSAWTGWEWVLQVGS
jgi:hypothetical protein